MSYDYRYIEPYQNRVKSTDILEISLTLQLRNGDRTSFFPTILQRLIRGFLMINYYSGFLGLPQSHKCLERMHAVIENLDVHRKLFDLQRQKQMHHLFDCLEDEHYHAEVHIHQQKH